MANTNGTVIQRNSASRLMRRENSTKEADSATASSTPTMVAVVSAVAGTGACDAAGCRHPMPYTAKMTRNMRAMFVRFVSRDGLSCLSTGGTLPVSSARFDNSRSAPDASGKADTATAEAVAGKTGTTSAHASVATNEAGTTVSTMPVSVRANRHAHSRMSTTGPMPVPMPASATATELSGPARRGAASANTVPTAVSAGPAT